MLSSAFLLWDSANQTCCTCSILSLIFQFLCKHNKARLKLRLTVGLYHLKKRSVMNQLSFVTVLTALLPDWKLLLVFFRRIHSWKQWKNIYRESLVSKYIIIIIIFKKVKTKTRSFYVESRRYCPCDWWARGVCPFICIPWRPRCIPLTVSAESKLGKLQVQENWLPWKLSRLCPPRRHFSHHEDAGTSGVGSS